MSILATNKGGSNLPPINAGTYSARCYSMIHIGTIEETILGKSPQMINKVQLTFEIPDEKFVFDEKKGSESRVVGKEFTLSMNEKSKLRKFLESWRGLAFTDEQSKEFDITKLLNVPCIISLIHKTSAKGNIYVEIATVSAPMKGMTVSPLTNPVFEFNFTDKISNFPKVPKFIREKIVRSTEWNAVDANVRSGLMSQCEPSTNTSTPAVVHSEQKVTTVDDLPF